jgi:hypothetical protein
MGKMNLNEEISKIKNMMGILSEAYRDDYKQSAPRAKSIAKIANSMRYKETSPNKRKSIDVDDPEVKLSNIKEPEQIDYEQYFPKVDEFFSGFEKYERDVEKDGMKMTETYYHDDMYVYMKVTKYDGAKDSEIYIKTPKFNELRQFLGVSSKNTIVILRNKYDVVNVIIRSPNENAQHIKSFKQPARPEPSTLELPFDEIMGHLNEKFEMKNIDFS